MQSRRGHGIMSFVYRRNVKEMMDPFLRMDLNLKESQKYVKQGRTYNSSIRNLEILMWFVYEQDLDRTHRQLGDFAAAERKVLRLAQETAHAADRIKGFCGELQKMWMPEEKREILETAMRTVESAQEALCGFWDMRLEVGDNAEKLMRSAADGREKLENAADALQLKRLLHDMSDAFRASTGKMEDALTMLKGMEPELRLNGKDREKVGDLIWLRNVDYEGCDKKAVLWTALKECALKVHEGQAGILDELEKAAEQHERLESRTAASERGNGTGKARERVSIRKKLEAFKVLQPERDGKAAVDIGRVAEGDRRAAGKKEVVR